MRVQNLKIPHQKLLDTNLLEHCQDSSRGKPTTKTVLLNTKHKKLSHRPYRMQLSYTRFFFFKKIIKLSPAAIPQFQIRIQQVAVHT